MRLTARPLVAGAVGLLLVAGVGWGLQQRRSPAWYRTDLALETPQEGTSGWRPVMTDLGQLSSWPSAAEVWAGLAGDKGPPPSGQVRALLQRPGSTLGWDLPPVRGRRWFTFVPLDGQPGAAFRVQVSYDGGRRETLLQTSASRLAGPAPAAIKVDLPNGARRLLLEALAAGSSDPQDYVLWGLPSVFSAHQPLSTQASGDAPTNVILIGIDTLRADAVGRPRGPDYVSTTPNLDALARRSDVWTAAYSTANATNPSFTSILTGLYVKQHGVHDLVTRLDDRFLTLAETFSSNGYKTIAILSARHLNPRHSGLGQGFDEVHLPPSKFAAEMAVDTAMTILQEKPLPFFLWLHLFDPHTPHTPPQPFASGMAPFRPNGLLPPAVWRPFRDPGPRRFDDPILGGHSDLYAAEVAYTDRQIGRLLDHLEQSGLAANTVVAVVADHGENLGEHGVFFRHAGLFDTTTHVPLMIHQPGRRSPARRSEQLVQTIDLFPTVLNLAHLQPPVTEGIDLYSLTAGSRPGRRAVFSEDVGGVGASIRTRRSRYAEIRDTAFLPGGSFLFDLSTDPLETRNLAGSDSRLEGELRQALERFRKAARRTDPGRPPSELSEEELAQLRALGYL